MSDWLDSEEFITKLHQCHDYRGDIDYDKLRIIIRSHFILKPVWTKITDDRESWPKESCRVLVTDCIEPTGKVFLVLFRNLRKEDTGFDHTTYEQFGDYFSAWMPLPEPYREESNDQD